MILSQDEVVKLLTYTRSYEVGAHTLSEVHLHGQRHLPVPGVDGDMYWAPEPMVLAIQSSEERGDKRYVLLAYVGRDVRRVEHIGSSTLVKIYHFKQRDEAFAILKDGDNYIVTNLDEAIVPPDDNRVDMDPKHTWVFPTWDAALATARLEMRR